VRRCVVHELCYNPQVSGTKVLLCVGGAGRSAGFPHVVPDGEKRKKFAQNVKQLLEKQNLDGIDLNWEAPTSERDWKDLGFLIQELRQTLGPSKLITMSIHPGQDRLLTEISVKNLDMVHVMAYDMQNFSPFELVQAIKTHLKIPASKITMGIPFYARNPATGEAETYSAIVQKHGPIKSSSNEVRGFMYNGVVLAKKKTRYAIDEGMAGVMIWELGQDIFPREKLSLLKAIGDTVRTYAKKGEEAKDEL
jgi:chitinase